MLKGLLLVGTGGMIGSMLRYLVALLVRPGAFPLATFTVNLAGCFLIGLLMGFALRDGAQTGNWRLFLATGLCGGFTTFSAFSLECVQMIAQQRYGAMLGYIAVSIVLGLAATFAGIQLSRI
ncbi:MAG TPA: fluoride efflux transporter CrcB [Chitinophagaceae bacterium]